MKFYSDSRRPELELDMIVATPCTGLVAQLTGSASHEFNLMNEFKRDPTRFEFTKKEAMYWNELKKVQGRAKEGATLFKSLDKVFISLTKVVPCPMSVSREYEISNKFVASVCIV